MLDIIWNISLICPWNCAFCCTDAVYVRQKFGKVIATERSLSETSQVDPQLALLFQAKYPNISPTVFDLALLDRQQRGLELDLQSKFNVLKNLHGQPVKIDFAGGDPLACYENFLIIKRAAQLFGKENISVTSTGFFVKNYGVEHIAEHIGEWEFTYDEPYTQTPCNRPNGYNSSNLKLAERFAKQGVKTKAQLPLHQGNMAIEKVEQIYQDLASKNIDELLLMRTFPVGRGMAFSDSHGLSKSALLSTIDRFKQVEQADKTSIRLQCALKHLYQPTTLLNPCDMMHESFGINSRGDLLLSAWANNEYGLPLSDDFVLGRIDKEPFSAISETTKFKSLFARMDENKGHCKIFSFVYGGRNMSALFANSDPLYIE